MLDFHSRNGLDIERLIQSTTRALKLIITANNLMWKISSMLSLNDWWYIYVYNSRFVGKRTFITRIIKGESCLTFFFFCWTNSTGQFLKGAKFQKVKHFFMLARIHVLEKILSWIQLAMMLLFSQFLSNYKTWIEMRWAAPKNPTHGVVTMSHLIWHYWQHKIFGVGPRFL